MPITDFFKLDPTLLELSQKAQAMCGDAFARIEEVSAYNQAKVLAAFTQNRVSESHFKGSTGYGYGDRGREVLDAVFAQVLGTQDALVRHNFVSGTHALSVALFGVLRPNDIMVSLTGKPYDTMEEVIGLRGQGNGSLRDFGIVYRQADLDAQGKPDLSAIRAQSVGAKLVYIQRSRGYSLRESLTVAQIGQIIQAVREVNAQAIVFVDNCYGEFVEEQEPSAVGADLIVGSLIKNAGGGIAQTGGYIAGRADLIELCSYRLTCVGMGKEVGCTLDQSQRMFMGLFFAPSVVASAVQTSVFATALFELLGYATYPRYCDYRTDIIAAIVLKTPQDMVKFCRGVQKGAPVDSFVTPEPWDMPGYDSQVIMAAGAFNLGSSIELSADGPMKEPYAVWLQGGLTYHTGKLGILLAAQELLYS